MKRVLFVTPTPKCPAAINLLAGPQDAGFTVTGVSLDGSSCGISHALQSAFGSCAPDLLLADLSRSPVYLPLCHLRRILQVEWGSDLQPLCLTLAAPELILNPESPAMADDFVLPPYSIHEIVARLNQLLFRMRHINAAGTLTFADVHLNISGREARDSNNSKLALTPREYDLLEFQLKHRGKLFARDRLLDLVWGVDFEGGKRTVDVHVRRLRAKLPVQVALQLETRRGFGYGFRLP